MKSKYKIGDRVLHKHLGAGEVTKVMRFTRFQMAYMVMFDKTPDVRYNMGKNPCFVHEISGREGEK